MRLAIGLLFPLVLAALAWHTARIKAMRSATGLLYVGAGVVLTGALARAGARTSKRNRYRPVEPRPGTSVPPGLARIYHAERPPA